MPVLFEYYRQAGLISNADFRSESEEGPSHLLEFYRNRPSGAQVHAGNTSCVAEPVLGRVLISDLSLKRCSHAPPDNPGCDRTPYIPAAYKRPTSFRRLQRSPTSSSSGDVISSNFDNDRAFLNSGCQLLSLQSRLELALRISEVSRFTSDVSEASLCMKEFHDFRLPRLYSTR